MIKKVKFIFAGLAMIFVTSSPSFGQVEEPAPPGGGYPQYHVCCQSQSTGCWARDGSYFPTDYVYYGHFAHKSNI